MTRTSQLTALTSFAAAHHGVLTRGQAAALGFERMAIGRLIDRGTLREPAPRVLVVAGSPGTWHQRLYVAVLAGGSGALAVGASAARLHRLDGFERAEQLHIGAQRGRRVAMPDVKVSQTAATYPGVDRVDIDGIPCAGLARTICDLAPMGPRVVERAVDDLQRRGRSLNWLAQTATRLRASGRAGIPAVEAELERRRLDPALRGSWFEKLVEECLRSPSLPGLVRQHEIRDGSGQFIARVDLAVPAIRLAIEAHSRQHHTGPRAEAIDEQRESLAIAEGWQFKYLGWYDVTQTPEAVRRDLERVVARRALDLGVDLGPAS